MEERVHPEQLRPLVFAGCTYPEIADYFGISEASVERMAQREPLAAVFRKSRADRKLSLRRVQTKLAVGGNVGMLIWLGKQELGQRERFDPIDVHVNVNDTERDEAAKRLEKWVAKRRDGDGDQANGDPADPIVH